MSDTAATPDNNPTVPSSHVSHRRRRMLKDWLARYFIRFGGVSVILAIVLIFFYLLYVVFPLFISADMELRAKYPIPGGHGDKTLYLSMEEQAEIGMRVLSSGEIVFFSTQNGETIARHKPVLPTGISVTGFAAAVADSQIFALALSDGTVKVLKHHYDITYPNDVRKITPDIRYPLGEGAIEVDPTGESLSQIAIQNGEDESTIVALTTDGRLLLTSISKETSLLDEENVTIEAQTIQIRQATPPVHSLLLDSQQRNLYVAGRDGVLYHYDVSDKEDVKQIEQLRVVGEGSTLKAIEFLTGDLSLLVGDDQGRISQWFQVRDKEGQKRLARIRDFKLFDNVSAISPEYYRKGFLATDGDGNVGIFHTTADRVVLEQPVTNGALTFLAVAPRADALLAQDKQAQLHFWHIDNEHPEVSWSSLWGKVWYESYDAPEYIWQSSSASNDFEPKFSLVPISFGTIKAAFYAMLIAMPLAIFGAIYTAYFMTPAMRATVKPTIEIMEALPTVILGFLAGLWLAPVLEDYLPGIITLLLIMPISVVLFGFAWHRLPSKIRNLVADGWQAALLIPVVLLTAWVSFALSVPLEQALFGGDIRVWLSNELGVDFDQRNALVVGLAMGFAVIPTIFSITEDAIFGVPRHLTNGSLALGATQWQTLTRVVILTASPGIFSAVMIGFGRAVGETMIVLMATGNTPVMDWSVFQGMRTLSANIAVEMPESEVASTHYRVLFLAALVLFLFTFVFNTAAEIVRQRLRKKYSSL